MLLILNVFDNDKLVATKIVDVVEDNNLESELSARDIEPSVALDMVGIKPQSKGNYAFTIEPVGATEHVLNLDQLLKPAQPISH